MNMPQEGFLRGILPGELSLQPIGPERLGARIVLFEYDRREVLPETLTEQLRQFRRENRLPPFAGYSQPVEFPDAPKVQVLAWTAENILFRPGHQRPHQFISMDDYRRWAVCEPLGKPRTFYTNCYDRAGNRLPSTFIVVA